MNILLVEDNELNMEITQFFSKKKGYCDKSLQWERGH